MDVNVPLGPWAYNGDGVGARVEAIDRTVGIDSPKRDYPHVGGQSLCRANRVRSAGLPLARRLEDGAHQQRGCAGGSTPNDLLLRVCGYRGPCESDRPFQNVHPRRSNVDAVGLHVSSKLEVTVNDQACPERTGQFAHVNRQRSDVSPGRVSQENRDLLARTTNFEGSARGADQFFVPYGRVRDQDEARLLQGALASAPEMPSAARAAGA